METKHEIFGRVSLELKQIDKDLAFVTVELERIGKEWQASAKLLIEKRGAELDRSLTDSTLKQAWDLVDRQAGLLALRSERQAQLDLLDS